MSKSHILPDALAPNLKVWFVGTAAGPLITSRSRVAWSSTLHKLVTTPRAPAIRTAFSMLANP